MFICFLRAERQAFIVLPRIVFLPIIISFHLMKPCRDCGAPTAPSARSCPRCGILNPVMQWVALPNGEHLTAREPVGSVAVAAPAPFSRLAPAPAPARARDPFADDRLAGWAIWSIVFAILSSTVVGGAIGGGIAGIIAFPIGAVLPARDDGRKLPAWLSFTLLGIGLVVLLSPILLLLLTAFTR